MLPRKMVPREGGMTQEANGRVLLVGKLDETDDVRTALGSGFECSWTDRIDVALQMLTAQRFDAIVTAYNLPFGDGLELLNKAIALHPNMSGVLLARYTNTAECKERAAGRFLVFGDADEVPHIMLWLERHVSYSQLMLALENLNAAVSRREVLPSG